MEDLQARADRRFQEALEESGGRDPREFYRERLRDLKGSDPEAYRRAVEHYRDLLIPGVAAGEKEPIQAWMEYGCLLAELTSPGRIVQVDPSGRAAPLSPPVPLDHLVLHLPGAPGIRAILVSLPAELSPAQKATYDLLVAGKQKIT